MYIKYLKVISISDFPVFFTSPLQDVMSNGILNKTYIKRFHDQMSLSGLKPHLACTWICSLEDGNVYYGKLF